MSMEEILKVSELFSDLPQEILREVAKISRQEKYSHGTTIFLEKEEARNFYILEEGSVSIRIQPAGTDKVITVAVIKEKGQIFGWSALVEPFSYTASAFCLEDTKALVIPGKEFIALLESKPEIGLKVMRRLASVIGNRLRATQEQLVSAFRPGVISHG